jgi:hypothetical protein
MPNGCVGRASKGLLSWRSEGRFSGKSVPLSMNLLTDEHISTKTGRLCRHRIAVDPTRL